MASTCCSSAPGHRRRLVGRVVLVTLGLGASCFLGCAARSVHIPRLELPPAGVKLDPPPPAHVMWLRITGARVPERDRSGRPYDEDGLPDPIVVISAEGKELLRTEAVQDTLTPLWPEGHAGNFALPAGSSILVEVLDSDGMGEQSMATANLPAPKLEDAVGGAVQLPVGPGLVVRLGLEPARAHLGLGFSYQMRGTQCVVTERFEHGPAGRAGMAVGDRIVAIDGAMVRDMTPAEVRSHFGSVPAVGVELQVLHATGTSETVRLVEGPVYVLDSERALLE